MNITLVKYSEEFSRNGLKTWLGMEGTLEPAETFTEAYSKCKKIAHTAFYGTNVAIPEPIIPDNQLPDKQIEKTDREKEIEQMKKEINEYTDPQQLIKEYSVLSVAWPEIKQTFNDKAAELLS